MMQSRIPVSVQGQARSSIETRLGQIGPASRRPTRAFHTMQILLDRGEQNDWFGSGESWIEAIVAASAFYICTRAKPARIQA
jgi:hypothetical protein